MNASDRINLLIEYILDTEHDDFSENVDPDHIYFHAYTLKFGEVAAENMRCQAHEEMMK